MGSKNLHWSEINPPRLLWIEGSPGPHEAEGYHESSHIGQLANLYQKKEEGRPLNRRLTNFLDDWETTGKKQVAFLMGIWWSKQGEGVHTF